MNVNLVTNFADRKGLWRDGCIVERLLTGWGHTVSRVQFNSHTAPGMADLTIFLETLMPHLLQRAPQNWLIPNPEWFTGQDQTHLQQLDHVLCKTREAEALFTPLTDRAVYIGFESEDRYDPTVPRETKVLHIAGNSILKGTQAVLEAWERYAPPYSLTVVGDEQIVKPRQIPNVTYRLGRLEDDELRRLQNSHLVHLCPSETEGWGHTLWEGMSCDATVLTTQEDVCGVWRLASEPYGCRELATLSRVDMDDLVAKLSACRPTQRVWHDNPRRYFLAYREAFRERFYALITDYAASIT